METSNLEESQKTVEEILHHSREIRDLLRKLNIHDKNVEFANAFLCNLRANIREYKNNVKLRETKDVQKRRASMQ